MRYEFDWDPAKERENVRKHHITFRQAGTVFHDPNHLSTYDEEHSEDEDRWVTLGLDSTGILRVVVHIFERIEQDLCEVRIISARKAMSAEVSQYREANP